MQGHCPVPLTQVTVAMTTRARGSKMAEISFNSLLGAVSRSNHTLRLGTRLKISEDPNPFVAPTLRVLGLDKPRPLDAEVLFFKASAAVGKSTIAQRLSHPLRVPLFALSKVPVSTVLLRAFFLVVGGGGDPRRAFHAGGL